MLRPLWIVLFLAAFIASGCAPSDGAPTAAAPTALATPPEQSPTTVVPDPDLRICSRLDLSNVDWPKSIADSNWEKYYALGLNISGSFEGRDGWKNISNNFDGQGLSLGLLQQNLGQGSLQPALIEMFKINNSALTANFTSADYNSLKTMLEKWQNSSISLPVASLSFQDSLFPDEDALSPLDESGNPQNFSVLATTPAQASVNWATANLYSGNDFIARWKNSFQTTAGSASYRSLQIKASSALFLKAKQYYDYFGFTELRFLLMLFDVVVQNGGFTQGHLSTYQAWVDLHPAASEQSRALALVEARLSTVRPQYVEDVRARKSSIIYGTGTVHQTVRNYPAEFCFSNLETVN